MASCNSGAGSSPSWRTKIHPPDLIRGHVPLPDGGSFDSKGHLEAQKARRKPAASMAGRTRSIFAKPQLAFPTNGMFYRLLYLATC